MTCPTETTTATTTTSLRPIVGGGGRPLLSRSSPRRNNGEDDAKAKMCKNDDDERFNLKRPDRLSRKHRAPPAPSDDSSARSTTAADNSSADGPSDFSENRRGSLERWSSARSGMSSCKSVSSNLSNLKNLSSSNAAGGGQRRNNAADGANANAFSLTRPMSDTAVCCAGRVVTQRRRGSGTKAPFLDPKSNLPRTNATFSLVQRSGAPLIRDVVSSIDRKTEAAARKKKQQQQQQRQQQQRQQQQRQRSEEEGCDAACGGSDACCYDYDCYDDPPRSELTALANSSQDAYYRVIAAASGGITSVLHALRTFPYDEETQASGCAALASMCVQNTYNQVRAGREGALEAVLHAMGTFPLNVGVQGAGCDALDALTSMTPRNVELLLKNDSFEEVVEGALERFLPPSCRDGAQAVLRRAAALQQQR